MQRISQKLIDLSDLNEEGAKLLKAFFLHNETLVEPEKVFLGHCSYFIPQGQEGYAILSFTQTLVRKPTRDQKICYSMMAKQPLSNGSFGTIYPVVGTITLGYIYETTYLKIKYNQKRLMKIQANIPLACAEAKLSTQIPHLHSKPVIIGKSDGRYLAFMLLKKCAGITMHEIYRQERQPILNINPPTPDRKMSVNKRIKITINLLSGLLILHANGIMHLDINPNNILVDQHGNVSFIDLGLAAEISNVSCSTIGALNYTSLESVTKKYALSEKSDVYSLALIILKLWKGTPRKADIKDLISALTQGKELATAATLFSDLSGLTEEDKKVIKEEILSMLRANPNARNNLHDVRLKLGSLQLAHKKNKYQDLAYPLDYAYQQFTQIQPILLNDGSAHKTLQELLKAFSKIENHPVVVRYFIKKLNLSFLQGVSSKQVAIERLHIICEILSKDKLSLLKKYADILHQYFCKSRQVSATLPGHRQLSNAILLCGLDLQNAINKFFKKRIDFNDFILFELKLDALLKRTEKMINDCQVYVDDTLKNQLSKSVFFSTKNEKSRQMQTKKPANSVNKNKIFFISHK